MGESCGQCSDKMLLDGAAPAMFHKSVGALVEFDLEVMRNPDAATEIMRGVVKECETAEKRLGRKPRDKAGRHAQGCAQAGGDGGGCHRRDETAQNKPGFGGRRHPCGEKGVQGPKLSSVRIAPRRWR